MIKGRKKLATIKDGEEVSDLALAIIKGKFKFKIWQKKFQTVTFQEWMKIGYKGPGTIVHLDLALRSNAGQYIPWNKFRPNDAKKKLSVLKKLVKTRTLTN